MLIRDKIVLTPYPFEKESKIFGESLLRLAIDNLRQQITQVISINNMLSFTHGMKWLTMRDNEIDESTLEQTGLDLVIEHSNIIENNIQSLFDLVSNLANGFASQMVNKMYETINVACVESGNVVMQSDYSSKAEAFLQMLKTIEFSVDENMQVQIPSLHMHPDELQALHDDLNKQDEVFHEEYKRIVGEKAEAAIEKEKARLSKYQAINL
jgi:hypothetical protein